MEKTIIKTIPVFSLLTLILHSTLFFPAELLSAESLPTDNSTQYITDNLSVPMRTGPNREFRFHRVAPFLKAGTKIEVIQVDSENKASQVRLNNGEIGWVETIHLVASPIAKDLLKVSRNEVKNLQQELSSLQQIHETSTGRQKKLSLRAEKLQREVTKLQNDLENEQLKYSRLSDSQRFEPFYAGGVVALVGLIFGLILGKRRKRKGSWD